MKGETSKSNVLNYYTKDPKGLEKLNKFDRDIFLSMIRGIKRNHLYKINVSADCPPQYNRYLPSSFEGSFLVIPYWISRSGVTFFIVATTLPWDQPPYNQDGNPKTVSFPYRHLYKNMKEVVQKEYPLWIGSAYKTKLYSRLFSSENMEDISKKSIDFSEDYVFPTKTYDEKNCLNEGDASFSKKKLLTVARRNIHDMISDLYYMLHKKLMLTSTVISSFDIRKWNSHNRDNEFESMIYTLHINGVKNVFLSRELYDSFNDKFSEEYYNINNLSPLNSYGISSRLRGIGRDAGSLEMIARLLWGIDDRAPLLLEWSKFPDRFYFSDT